MLSGLTGTPSLAEELDSEHRPFLNATPQRRPLTPGSLSPNRALQAMAAILTALRSMTGAVESAGPPPGPLPATTPARRESASKTAETRALM